MSAIFHKLKPWLEPFRYVFKDPDTGREFEEKTKEELITVVQNYRRNNGFEAIEEIVKVLENYWCCLPENAGKCEVYELQRSFFSALKGGIALIHAKLLPKNALVAQEEADARGLHCKGCRFNVRPMSSGAFQVGDDIAEYLGPKRHSENDPFLGTCALCTCPLKLKIHLRGPFEIDPLRRASYEEVKCWQLKG